MERFAKRIVPDCRHATRKISGQGKFRGIRALRETFRQKHKKKDLTRKQLLVFPPR